MEDFVPMVGPGVFILLLFVTPWFWGVPTALAAAELSTKRPVAGGYYRWAREYLGDFWGYQEGVWNLLTSFLDNALYPVLFGRALAHVIPGFSPLEQWLAAVVFILFFTWLNYRGIQLAGVCAICLNVFLIAPLFWLVGVAAFHLEFNPVVPLTAPGTDFAGQLGTCLALAMWLYSGYYEMTAASEEIENPARNIPLALLMLTPLVILSYAVPTLAGLAAVGGWQDWTSGQFASMGRVLGGPILGGWIFLGGVASYSVIFLAYVLWWSRLVWAMATDGHLPRMLSKLHPRYGTPHRVLLAYAAVYAVMAALPFEDLLVADIWLTGASNVILQACLIRSRRGPDPGQGFRIPGGRLGLFANVTLPALTCLLLLVLTGREHWPLGAGALLAAPALYWLTAARGRASAVA
jgi:amino acid transporter